MEPETESVEIIPLKPKAEVMIYDPYNQTIILYDCERMYNFDDTKYIIEIGEYGDQEQAREERQILGDAGISSIVFWEGCFCKFKGFVIMRLYYKQLDLARKASSKSCP